MKFRTASLLVAASALVLSASLAAAQSGLKPIPKPSDRRAGELEGWSDASKPQGKEAGKPQAREVGKGNRHAVAGRAGKAGKSVGADKPAARSEGGGIPLPSSRTDPNDYAPVGFDKNGNLGTGLKF